MEHWWLQGVHSSWCGRGSTCNEILPEGVAQSCSGTLLGGGVQSCSGTLLGGVAQSCSGTLLGGEAQSCRGWGSILHVGNLTIGMVLLQIKGWGSILHQGGGLNFACGGSTKRW